MCGNSSCDLDAVELVAWETAAGGWMGVSYCPAHASLARLELARGVRPA
jgi:hypothetical protein